MPENRGGSGRANSTSWKPGQSGNPGGRPAIAREIKELAQEHAKDALETIIEIMVGAEEPGPRLAAAKEVLKQAGCAPDPDPATTAPGAGPAITLAPARVLELHMQKQRDQPGKKNDG